MGGTDLAPSISIPGQRQVQDASAKPSSQVTPKPCTQIPNHSLAVREASDHTYSGHARETEYTGDERYKTGSMSSQGSSSIFTPMSSLELEKSIATPEHAHTRAATDPEKAMDEARRYRHRSANAGDNISLDYSDEGDDTGRRKQEENAVKILLWLSGPCVLLSGLNTAWACIALVITLLTQPIRLCARRPSFGQELGGLLGPALNLQFKAIYTPLPPHANEDASYHTFMLVLVHMLCPFLSLGMILVAWVLAVYWVSSAAVGDPAGLDKGDDGRDTVLWLRDWWEAWLLKAVKE